jgi:hypothetical protein
MKLDEEKLQYIGLAQDNVFGSAKLHSLNKLVKSTMHM